MLWSVQPRIRDDPTDLVKRYIAIFSILVWMKKPEKISIIKTLGIDDTNLPIDDRLIHGTGEQGVADFLPLFSKQQWKFCPLTLDSRPFKRSLHPFYILPITSKTSIDPQVDLEDDVILYKAQGHRLCLGSLPASHVTSQSTSSYDTG